MLEVPGDSFANVAFRLARSGDVTFTVNDQPDEIVAAGLTLLDDGRVLVSGGGTILPSGDADPVDFFQIFDPQTQTFTTQP